MNNHICICYHKPSHLVQNTILHPLHVGKENSTLDLGFSGDNSGDNISYKNPYFCELTATYWLWKNINADIVGLFHYRRFLNFRTTDTKFHTFTPDFAQKYGLTEEIITQTLKECDIILPKKTKPITTTVYDYYQKEHIISDMDKTLEIIEHKYPEQYDIALQTLKSNSRMYQANMLICHKPIFDKYASWLFSILFELENQIQTDVLTRSSYQQRAYGFLAERLMAVFIATHPELKIKELPLLYQETRLNKWLKYRFRRGLKSILTIFNIRNIKWNQSKI